MNSKSTKVGQHYHGISMTTMQYLSNENYNGLQQTLHDLSKESSRKLELPESYTNFKQLPFKKFHPYFLQSVRTLLIIFLIIKIMMKRLRMK